MGKRKPSTKNRIGNTMKRDTLEDLSVRLGLEVSRNLGRKLRRLTSMPAKLSPTAIRRIRNLAQTMPLRDVARVTGFGHSTVERYAKGIRPTASFKVRWQLNRPVMLQISKLGGTASARKKWQNSRSKMLAIARKGLKAAQEAKRRARENK